MAATTAQTKPETAVHPLPRAVAHELATLKSRQGSMARAGKWMLVGAVVAFLCAAALAALHWHWQPATSIAKPALPSFLVAPVQPSVDPQGLEGRTFEGVLEHLTGGVGKLLAVMVLIACLASAVASQSLGPAIVGFVVVGGIGLTSSMTDSLFGGERAGSMEKSSVQASAAYPWEKAIAAGDYEALKPIPLQGGSAEMKALILAQAAVNASHGRLSELTAEQRAYAARAARYAQTESAANRLTIAPATLYALQQAGQVRPLSPQALDYETTALRRSGLAWGTGIASAVVALALLCAAAAAGGLGSILRRRTRRIDQLLAIPLRLESMPATDTLKATLQA